MRSFSSYHQKGYRRVSEIDLFRFSHFISTHSTFCTCPFRKREAKKQNQIGEEGVYTKSASYLQWQGLILQSRVNNKWVRDLVQW